MPDVPLVVDRYEDALHIAEFDRPHDRSPAQHADWLDLMARTAAKVLEVPRERVFLKHRDRQRGADQYGRVDDRQARFVVNEGGLKFVVNLSDYVDTGLFLDHRITRQMVREAAAGKRFLESVRLHRLVQRVRRGRWRGDRQRRSINRPRTSTGLARTLSSTVSPAPQHNSSAATFVSSSIASPPRDVWDLAVVDPPTFSNTKGLEVDWDVQRDHAGLLATTGRRTFRPAASCSSARISAGSSWMKRRSASYTIRDITRQTIPEDFRNERIHKCWKLVRRE